MGLFRWAKYNECKLLGAQSTWVESKILGNIAPVKVSFAEVHWDKNLALNFYLSQTNQHSMQGAAAYLTQVLTLTPLPWLSNKNQT